MLKALNKIKNWQDRPGPLVLCIMDGIGISPQSEGNAVKAAKTPCLDELKEQGLYTELKAHGTYVGLPTDGDMGNSEVGHNALGAGRVFDQGAKLVQNAINTGKMFRGPVWQKLLKNVKDNNSTLHFLGLLSDGNVHSHWKHLESMLIQAKKDGLSRVRIHALLDGRDVGETSALDYFEPFETFLAKLSDDKFDARIASGGGRMLLTMDRYEAEWDMVERGWNTHVRGEGPIFDSAVAAIKSLRESTGQPDQSIPAFIIGEDGQASGPIRDGDSVILFNFRGDRALEISNAFDKEDFAAFDRGPRPNVEYAGIMEYDGDLHIPKQFLVAPPAIDRTMVEYLCATNIKQYAISETQKYGHVTYFFNGNKSGKIDEESQDFKEIESFVGLADAHPEMKSQEITQKTIEAINLKKYKFIILNYPNGDMVGHTGNFAATVKSVENVDKHLAELRAAVESSKGILLVTADHGNADEMYELDKKSKAVKRAANGKAKAKTSHTLNPVPFIIYDTQKGAKGYSPELNKDLGLSSVTATCINLLGYEAPADYDKGIINLE